MHPSANYDYLMHGDHIHWCDVEAKGISRCEELAVREHSAAAGKEPLAEVGLPLVIAMMITIVAGLIWGVMGRDLELPRDFRTQRPKYHRNVGDAASAVSTSPEGQSRHILPRRSP